MRNQVVIFLYFVFTLTLLLGISLTHSNAPNLGTLVSLSSMLAIMINLLIDIARR
jgi:hypothetical protein